MNRAPRRFALKDRRSRLPPRRFISPRTACAIKRACQIRQPCAVCREKLDRRSHEASAMRQLAERRPRQPPYESLAPTIAPARPHWIRRQSRVDGLKPVSGSGIPARDRGPCLLRDGAKNGLAGNLRAFCSPQKVQVISGKKILSIESESVSLTQPTEEGDWIWDRRPLYYSVCSTWGAGRQRRASAHSDFDAPSRFDVPGMLAIG
jgi:hypothetical protein